MPENEVFEDNISGNEYDTVVLNDGHLFLYNSDSEESCVVSLSCEDWIDKNEQTISILYNILASSEFGSLASFSDFCEYLVYASRYGKTNIQSWLDHCDDFTYKMTGCRNPSKKEFCAHYLPDLLKLYMLLDRNSEFCIGKVESFMNFIYNFSHHVLY